MIPDTSPSKNPDLTRPHLLSARPHRPASPLRYGREDARMAGDSHGFRSRHPPPGVSPMTLPTNGPEQFTGDARGHAPLLRPLLLVLLLAASLATAADTAIEVRVQRV